MSFSQFFQENLFFFLLLFAVLGGIVFMEIKTRNAAGKKVNNAQAAMLANNNGTLVDIRSAADYKQAHIAGAKNIPTPEIGEHLGKIKKAKDCPVVLYDNDGFSTAAAAKVLQSHGFEQIYVLDGGINAWLSENLPVVSK
ncbi:MAG: rhodanese-like domain-containing protein [Cardiobacteriaceae bacterium]|nr:rhodanese-like domain-containing protein [Cardiobacteriaceae bacterium]